MKGKRKYFSLGVDTASTSITVALLAPDGKPLLGGKEFPLGTGGFADLMAALVHLGARPTNTRVVIEATGRYHLSWVAALEREGFATVVLNPALSGHAKPLKQFVRGNKTDPIDAEGLALLGLHRWAELEACSNQSDSSKQALKMHCSVMSHLRRSLTNTTRAAQDLLGALWPESRELGLKFSSNEHGLPALLLRVAGRAELSRLQASTLRRHGILRVDALREALRSSFVAEAVFDAGLPALQQLCRLLVELRERMEAMDQDILHRLRNVEPDPNYRVASTIPCFGDRTLPVLLAYLPGQWRQWGSKRSIANKLQAYWGMEPRVRQSGRWRGQVKMSKRGCEPPRTALMNVARVSLIHDREMRQYYQKKKAEGMEHILALTHLMRRHLRRFVAVIYEEKPFVANPQTSS